MCLTRFPFRLKTLMFAFADVAAGFYTKDAVVVTLAAAMISYAAIGVICDTGQSLLTMSLRARGDTWAPTLLHLFSYGVVMMPATYIFMFVLERGAMGIVDGVLVGTLVPFILVALRYRWLDRQSLSQPAVSS